MAGNRPFAITVKRFLAPVATTILVLTGLAVTQGGPATAVPGAAPGPVAAVAAPQAAPAMPLPVAKKRCRTGVYASGTASCPFARNVADAWFRANGASRLYGVYSPTTGRTYNLKCKWYSSRSYAKCTTGRAIVYVYASSGGSAIDCGNDIWAGGNADCQFAGNVADEYYNSGYASELYDVYWPAYGEYYDVSCSGYNPVTCGFTGTYVYIY